jgi:hypothetical protein
MFVGPDELECGEVCVDAAVEPEGGSEIFAVEFFIHGDHGHWKVFEELVRGVTVLESSALLNQGADVVYGDERGFLIETENYNFRVGEMEIEANRE